MSITMSMKAHPMQTHWQMIVEPALVRCQHAEPPQNIQHAVLWLMHHLLPVVLHEGDCTSLLLHQGNSRHLKNGI